MKLSIVIPCYNEAQTIRTLVERVRAAPVKHKEIIIVDDCSRDGTRDLLRTQIAPLVDQIIYHRKAAGGPAAVDLRRRHEQVAVVAHLVDQHVVAGVAGNDVEFGKGVEMQLHELLPQVREG